MIDALVIGGGSIGKRHLRNVLASGRSAAVVETRADRRTEIAEKSPARIAADGTRPERFVGLRRCFVP